MVLLDVITEPALKEIVPLLDVAAEVLLKKDALLREVTAAAAVEEELFTNESHSKSDYIESQSIEVLYNACGIEKEIDTDDSNNEKLDDEEEKPAFQIVSLSGKGTGLLAARNLFPGNVIMSEKPVLHIHEDVFEDIEKTEELIDKQVLELSSSERELVLGLTDSRNPHEPSYLGIFYTNDMNYDGDAVLCPLIARANHSCRPNAEFVTRRDLGLQLLVAIYPIKEGEEITINYMAQQEEGSEIGENRRAYLRKWYNFQCLCASCTLQGDDLEKEERIRESIKEFQAVGEDNLTIDELEMLRGLMYKIQGKQSYILDLIDLIYLKSTVVKYAVQGLDVALKLFGEDSKEKKKWMERLKRAVEETSPLSN